MQSVMILENLSNFNWRLLHCSIILYFRVRPVKGTAGEEDFSPKTKYVTFQPSETENKIVEIDLIDDDVVESLENFTVMLSSSTFVAFGSPSTINIHDNDGKCGFCSILSSFPKNLATHHR